LADIILNDVLYQFTSLLFLHYLENKNVNLTHFRIIQPFVLSTARQSESLQFSLTTFYNSTVNVQNVANVHKHKLTLASSTHQ